MAQNHSGKDASELTATDFAAYPVGRFDASAEAHSETWMVPVIDYPLTDLSGHVVGTQVLLADGSLEWVAIGNTWLDASEFNNQSQFFSFMRGTERCTWSAAGHGHVGASGASAVAAFLKRRVEEVFPFSYDISSLVVGTSGVVARKVGAIDAKNPMDRVALAMEATRRVLEP